MSSAAAIGGGYGYDQGHREEVIDPALWSAPGVGASSVGPTPGQSRKSVYQQNQEPPIPEGRRPSKKRSRLDGDDEQGERVRKTRQTQSCDACRARKVRCDRVPPTPSGPGSSQPQSQAGYGACTMCRNLGLACAFTYVQKKRGPPNLYVRKIQEGSRRGSELRSLESPPPADHSRDMGSSTRPYGDGDKPFDGIRQTMHRERDGLDGYSQGRDNMWPVADIAAQSAIATTRASVDPYPIEPMPPRSSITDPLASLSPLSTIIGPATTSSFSPLALSYHPGSTTNPFDAVLPRALLYHIVDLYFDYIYALVPCVHRPSFMADLRDGREEKAGQEEWAIMVLTIVSSTLVQLPRAFVRIPRGDARDLVARIGRIVKAYMSQEYNVPTLSRCVIIYLQGLVYLSEDKRVMASQSLYMCISVMTLMRLNEEQTYLSMKPIEREVARRVFWLCYGGEKTVAVIEVCPVFMTEDDFGDVALPAEIDDEYIQADRYLPQPADKTSVMVGFCYISKLFEMIGRVLKKRRIDRRFPPSGPDIETRLQQVMEFYRQICRLMIECPEVLRLDMDNATVKDDWNTEAVADVRSLFLDPKAPRAMVKDAFLVQQGNIYVTQQMARQLVLQYRDELLDLQVAQRSLPDKRPRWGDGQDEDDDIASDLLMVLQSIPIQVIAVNSMSLVGKVRFVASTLLDALSSPVIHEQGVQSTVSDNKVAGAAVAKASKAQSYLWDFLRILGEIESLVSLKEDGASA